MQNIKQILPKFTQFLYSKQIVLSFLCQVVKIDQNGFSSFGLNLDSGLIFCFRWLFGQCWYTGNTKASLWQIFLQLAKLKMWTWIGWTVLLNCLFVFQYINDPTPAPATRNSIELLSVAQERLYRLMAK